MKQLYEKNNGLDWLIKIIEYMRGLYRYPRKMLGRHIPPIVQNPIDLLVLAAHPDDEVIGMGTILNRSSKKGEKIKIVYITNGTAGIQASWKMKSKTSIKIAQKRFKEG